MNRLRSTHFRNPKATSIGCRLNRKELKGNLEGKSIQYAGVLNKQVLSPYEKQLLQLLVKEQIPCVYRLVKNNAIAPAQPYFTKVCLRMLKHKTANQDLTTGKTLKRRKMKLPFRFTKELFANCCDDRMPVCERVDLQRTANALEQLETGTEVNNDKIPNYILSELGNNINELEKIDEHSKKRHNLWAEERERGDIVERTREIAASDLFPIYKKYF